MADDSEKSGADASAKPDKPDAGSEKSELPSVESPSISPAEPDTADEPAPAPSTAIVPFPEPILESPIAPGPSPRKPFRLRARHKLMAALAASVVVAGAVGVLTGVAASGGFRKQDTPKIDTAALDERKAVQQSLARLNKEIGTLKTSLDATSKAAHTQIARLTEKLNREAAEITGSISAPQTTAPQTAPTQAQTAPAPSPVQTTATPLPTPRPQQMAALEPQRPAVVQDWTIRDTRNGYVYVQNRGEVYEVMPGVPLPGLGTVEQIRRQDGRWVVVTPRGLIVSARDRAYFD